MLIIMNETCDCGNDSGDLRRPFSSDNKCLATNGIIHDAAKNWSARKGVGSSCTTFWQIPLGRCTFYITIDHIDCNYWCHYSVYIYKLICYRVYSLPSNSTTTDTLTCFIIRRTKVVSHNIVSPYRHIRTVHPPPLLCWVGKGCWQQPLRYDSKIH